MKRKYDVKFYGGGLTVWVIGVATGKIYSFGDFMGGKERGPKYPNYIYEKAQKIINWYLSTPAERKQFGHEKP